MAGIADVTIVVVARERFSRSIPSLESIYKNTPQPFKLVYVDGNSPKHIRNYLAAQSAARGFKLLRFDHYLVPNQARNLGVAAADTKYVVFVDNDVLVSPGWISQLVRCAEETEAWLVIPLFLQGQFESREVHMAGGNAYLELEDGRRVFKNSHRFAGRPLDEVRDQLKREPISSVEYHCLLARRDIFERIGPLDEQIPSVWEHADIALAVQQAGGAIYFEPDAVVSYDFAGGLRWSDLPYFTIRWSDEWGRMSVDRFISKWGLPADDRDVKYMYHYSAAYRRRFLRRWLPLDPYLFGRQIMTPTVLLMDRLLKRFFGRSEWRVSDQAPLPARA